MVHDSSLSLLLLSTSLWLVLNEIEANLQELCLGWPCGGPRGILHSSPRKKLLWTNDALLLLIQIHLPENHVLLHKLV